MKKIFLFLIIIAIVSIAIVFYWKNKQKNKFIPPITDEKMRILSVPENANRGFINQKKDKVY